MTDDLITFLRARLDEDQAVAQAATAGPWTTMGQRVMAPSPPSTRPGVGMAAGHAAASADFNETAAHIARHDPARVLAEVEAKRILLGDHERFVAERRRMMGGWDSYPEASPVLTAFAAAYADHPDYREEWRP